MDKFWTFVIFAQEYTDAYWRSVYVSKGPGLKGYYYGKSLQYEGFLIGMAYALDIDAPEHQELFTRIVRNAFPDLSTQISNRSDSNV